MAAIRGAHLGGSSECSYTHSAKVSDTGGRDLWSGLCILYVFRDVGMRFPFHFKRSVKPLMVLSNSVAPGNGFCSYSIAFYRGGGLKVLAHAFSSVHYHY